MPSPDACSHTLPSTGTTLTIHAPPHPNPHHPYMSLYTHSIVSRPSHHLNSMLAESAHISGHLLNLFPAGYCWRGPPCSTLHVQPLFSTQRLDLHSREGAHSLLQYNHSFYLYPTLPAIFNAKLCAAWKARENSSCSNSLIHQSILFHSSSLFVFVIEGSTWNWIVLGFHGRRLWLCRETETICGFQLETAFIPPPLYSKWTSELLEVFIFYLFLSCKHCMWHNLTVNRVVI